MRRVMVPLLAVGLVSAVLFAPSVSAEKITLSDSILMSFDTTYTDPDGWLDLVAKTDVAGLGVQYDVELYGPWELEIGIGGPSPLSDLSGFEAYILTFTNVSDTDTFAVNLYLETGEGHFASVPTTLLPGWSSDLSLDLSTVGDVENVSEIGFALSAWHGNEFGHANAIHVKAEDDEGDGIRVIDGNSAVPEASTLILFGTGLVGVLAMARRKLPFLTK